MKSYARFKGHIPHISSHHMLKSNVTEMSTDANVTEMENKTSRIIAMNPTEVFITYHATSTIISSEMIVDHLVMI